jgi:mannitol-1-phosphate/altronate dehydrogenase
LKKKEIVFLGAGAIGRGYLPWIFPVDHYEFIFVDSDPGIISTMSKNLQSTSFMAKDGKLKRLTYKIKKAYLADEFDFSEVSDPAAVFVQVGPRNCIGALGKMRDAHCPIILCENDHTVVEKAREFYNKDNFYFGVPDVITSNMAPPECLNIDPLAVTTEDGVMFVDENANNGDLIGDLKFVSPSELYDKQWRAKLYLHNTPHCIAAYLGALLGKRFLHEAMAIEEIDQIVEGVMLEMLNALKLRWDISHEFVEWYAEKELARFRNNLLYDPISRVAREPLRKLELEGRLIGASNICLAQGFLPENIMIGIIAAILFSRKDDSDRHLSMMRNAMNTSAFLVYILGLRKGEALEIALTSQFESIRSRLNKLMGKYKSPAGGI